MSGFLLWVCRIFSGLFQNFRAFRVFVELQASRNSTGSGFTQGRSSRAASALRRRHSTPRPS